MTAPNPARQRVAQKALDGLFAEAANVWVLHYSCESFYDRSEGRSPRITSIALSKLDSAQTVSFSIHQIAERQDIPFDRIEEHYNQLEEEMLKAFFGHLAGHKGMKYVHWHMRDVNYGFQAIEHRFEVLGGESHVVDDRVKFDLARILSDIYGVSYIGHPRMSALLEKNCISARHFLTGAAEAKAFEQREFAALHQSTLKKVDVIADFARRAHDRTLKTNTTWWEMRGGKIRTVVNWVLEHKAWSFMGVVVGIVGVAVAIFFRPWG